MSYPERMEESGEEGTKKETAQEQSVVPLKDSNPRVEQISENLLADVQYSLPELTEDQVKRLRPVLKSQAERMAELEDLAAYDTLLRRFFRHQRFLEILNEEAQAAENTPQGKLGSAVIFLDLDNFKAVNDSFGHSAGDELLRTTGNAVLKSIRPGDTVGRVGGEELGIIIRRTSLDGAVAATRRIQRAVLQASQEHPDLGIYQTVSVGISMITPHLTGEEVLKTADQAMYFSKRSGKDRMTIAKRDLNQRLIMIPVEPLKPGKEPDFL